MDLGPSYSWCDFFNVTETSPSVHAWVIRKLRTVDFLPLLHMKRTCYSWLHCKAFSHKVQYFSYSRDLERTCHYYLDFSSCWSMGEHAITIPIISQWPALQDDSCPGFFILQNQVSKENIESSIWWWNRMPCSNSSWIFTFFSHHHHLQPVSKIPQMVFSYS